MGGFSITHWLILILFLGFPLGIFFWLRRRSRSSHSTYRSLRVTSPVLNFLIILAMIGKPFLEYFKDQQWQSDVIPPALLLALGGFFLICVYAAVGATAYFFYRAIENINFFVGARVRAPATAILMVVPFVNFIAMPFVHYFTYYRSMNLSPEHRVSRFNAAVLAIGAFVLLVVSLASAVLSNNTVLRSGADPLSLSIITTCAGLAAGILFTRIVSRVFKAQEAYAAHVGIIGPLNAAREPVRGGLIDNLRSCAVVFLIAIAIFGVPNRTSPHGRLRLRWKHCGVRSLNLPYRPMTCSERWLLTSTIPAASNLIRPPGSRERRLSQDASSTCIP